MKHLTLLTLIVDNLLTIFSKMSQHLGICQRQHFRRHLSSGTKKNVNIRTIQNSKLFSDRRTHVKNEMALHGTMRSQQVMNNKLINLNLQLFHFKCST